MPGPPGTERKQNAQTKVLIGYTVASRPGEYLGVYMHLHPGDEVVHLEKVNGCAREKDPNHKPYTLGDWRGFQAILFMEPLHKENGHPLWNTGAMSHRNGGLRGWLRILGVSCASGASRASRTTPSR
jgi:hypothetical protein